MLAFHTRTHVKNAMLLGIQTATIWVHVVIQHLVLVSSPFVRRRDGGLADVDDVSASASLYRLCNNRRSNTRRRHGGAQRQDGQLRTQVLHQEAQGLHDPNAQHIEKHPKECVKERLGFDESCKTRGCLQKAKRSIGPNNDAVCHCRTSGTSNANYQSGRGEGSHLELALGALNISNVEEACSRRKKEETRRMKHMDSSNKDSTELIHQRCENKVDVLWD